MNKKEFGINGVHAKLGRDVTDAEFRGYVIAKMESHDKQTEEIKASIKETKDYIDKLLVDATKVHADQNTRIVSLETTRTQQTGFIAGVSALAGLAITLFLKFIDF